MKQTEWTLHKKNGVPGQYTAQVRTCTPADHAQLFALQNAVRAAMPDPGQFLPNSAEELLADLHRSLCVGVWAEGEAIAYAILRYCGADAHNYAYALDVPESDVPYWANGDTVLVAPAWRGNGLQQRLVELLIRWRKPQIIGIGCTVSPQNSYSLQNMQACGFSLYTRRLMYGRHDRYVLRRQLAPLPGKYRHFKGGEYRVLALATHSETREPMVVYQALYGEQGIWVRPAEMWFAHIDRAGYSGPRFCYLGE